MKRKASGDLDSNGSSEKKVKAARSTSSLVCERARMFALDLAVALQASSSADSSSSYAAKPGDSKDGKDSKEATSYSQDEEEDTEAPSDSAPNGDCKSNRVCSRIS